MELPLACLGLRRAPVEGAGFARLRGLEAARVFEFVFVDAFYMVEKGPDPLRPENVVCFFIIK